MSLRVREQCIVCSRVKMDDSTYFVATAPADDEKYVGATLAICPECTEKRRT